MAKRVTIRDVADSAGVSIQTVSRVLNKKPDVANETREHVWQVIETLQYQPSAVARSLVRKRTFTLATITAGLQYTGPSRTLNGIATEAENHGYGLLLRVLPDLQTVAVQPLLDHFRAMQVDGVIWAVPEVGDNRAWLYDREAELPLPMIFLTTQGEAKYSSVSIDNHAGGKIATEHLINVGYRHIAHIAGPLSWWESRQRKAGWESALRAAGIETTRRQWVEADWTSASGILAIRELFQKYPEMDAVFVANDQMALGVLQYASRCGLVIPKDFAVVGYDGIPESAEYWPPLTTIHQDQHLLGIRAVRELLVMVEAKGEPQQQFLIQPELVVRASSIAT